ncbi:uncharacterized protein LOC124267208 isoform X2 [Haliotis rubra]|uniref:uncharacterized protein LOC124267208 isoform X2 n=1 Tax=Haliotis rubra TaxID=36100 RepID=UPI001EE58D3C|nr:uncharacterized protein LOC124267208 isoform X2 [Haliotis rubra]
MPTPDKSTGLEKTVTSTLTVTPTKPGEQTVCVDAGTGSDADRICYVVNVKKPVPGKTTATNPGFLEPSLPDESTVNCQVTVPCHAMFHTAKCPLTSGSTSAMTFPAISTDGTCQTDVLFTPPPGGDSNVCLSTVGEKRCYKVNVIATDECNPNPCLNGGGCANQPQKPPGYRCACTESFTGDTCQNPTTTNPCSSGGILQSTTSSCDCPLGYTGPTCQFGPSANTGSTPKYADNNMENGGTIKCVKDTPCVFPVHTQAPGGSHTAPTLTPGPTSGNVGVSVDPTPKLDTATGVPGLYTTPVTLTSPDKGPKKVCFKLTSATADSVCYNVDVTDVGLTTPNPTGSHFTNPTLPDGSSLTCENECHILVHSTKDPVSGNCEQVSSSSTIGTTFKTVEDGSDCVTDVLYKPDSTNNNLCIDAGPSGEHRCYDLRKTPVTDPCAGESCSNQGSCLKQSTAAECVCDAGHTGSKCQTASSSTTDGFSSPTLLGGSVIPCIVGTTCTLPVMTRPGHSLKTPIASNIPLVVEPGLTPAAETKIQLSPTDKNIGENKMCVETQDGSSKRCYIVKVQSPGGLTTPPGSAVGTSMPGTLSGTLSGLGVDSSKPHVLRPTLTSGTIIPCPSSCDISILVDPGTNPQGGVEVVQTRGPPIATPTITPTPDGKFNIKVPITPDSAKLGLQPVCFKVRNKLTSLEGNEWCANINPTPHVSTPKPALGLTPKEIISTSLPDNSVVTCTVDTTCSVDMKTIPGTGFQPTTGAIPATVTTDPTNPDLHTLSVTPSQTDIGEHTVCATTTNHDRKCYTIKVTPNPNTFGKDPTKTHLPTNPNLPCGPNDHPEIVGAASSVECLSSGCSIHVLVKPPSCVTTNPISVNPVGTSQFSNGPVRPVGSYKDVEIQIGPSAPGSKNVCMKASAGVSLISRQLCIKVETKLDPSGSIPTPGAKPKPARPTQVTCTLGTQCPIPIATLPDRLLQQSPNLPVMPPILSGGQSIQPVLYHATVPGHHHVCVQAESISDRNDVETICMDVDVVAPTPEPGKQCIGATKQQMAYHSGRMTCKCTDPVTKKTTTVIRPRVSNTKLLSVAGVGFGSGVGTLALVALVYLAVTKLKSMPSSGDSSSNRDMLNFDYDRNY